MRLSLFCGTSAEHISYFFLSVGFDAGQPDLPGLTLRYQQTYVHLTFPGAPLPAEFPITILLSPFLFCGV